jgi:hypothetical protein
MNPIIFPIKSDPLTTTVKNLLSNYSGAYAPEQFQRPESWGEKERKNYFFSVLMNRLEGSFVFVDLELALNRLKQIDPSDRAYLYFENLISQLIEKIVLEGNNRLKFFEALFSDEYTIPNGVYNYVSDPHTTSLSQFVVGKHNNVFSKLDPHVKKVILGRKVVISEYTQIDYTGLSQVFINVNSGVPLNAQELRNAMDTPWADYVRMLRSQIAPLLMKIFPTTRKTNYKKRLVGDEWIVDCLDMVINNYENEDCPDTYEINGVTQTSKNSLYKSAFDEEKHLYYLEKFLLLSDFVDKMLDEGREDISESDIIRKSSVTNLFWMMCNGIETYEQAVEVMCLYIQSIKDKDLINDDDNTFKYCCEGASQKNMQFRMIVLSEIVNEVTESVLIS